MSEADRPGAVLVVDDDVAIRRSLERGLRPSGFAVRTAESGPQALAAVRDAPPDVLVLDVSMPGMSGIEVCERLRDDGQDLPVLMLSALDEIADGWPGSRRAATTTWSSRSPWRNWCCGCARCCAAGRPPGGRCCGWPGW
jgi:CheY-like chemotaxis protein